MIKKRNLMFEENLAQACDKSKFQSRQSGIRGEMRNIADRVLNVKLLMFNGASYLAYTANLNSSKMTREN